MPISSDLEFDPGSPPLGWLKSPFIEAKARATCLWEMTMGLIHNEEVLKKNPQRYLAMIHEHKVSARRDRLTSRK